MTEAWDEKVLRYLDGELDGDLEREVRERLLADGEARERFVALACQQQAFADLLKESAAPARRTHRARRRIPSGRPLGFLLAAAAAVVVALLGAAVLLKAPARRPSLPVATKEVGPDPEAREREENLLREERRQALAEIEARRKRAQAELLEIERRKEQLLAERARAGQEEARRRADEELRRNEDRRRDAEARVEQVKAEERKLVEAPVPATRTAAATVERAEGDVAVATDGARKPASAGQALPAGAGLETGAKSAAALRFQDGTRLELGPETALGEVREREPGGGSGKRLHLARGVLGAEVARQPALQPMVIATPHGEVRVVGTALRIVVEAGSTRVEVTEGKVRLTRALDRKSADVAAGQFATAAELKALPSTLLGLVGHWKLDEGTGSAVQDASGHGHHATLAGSFRRAAGRLGLAVELDGTSAAEAPHAESLSPGASAWTVAAWVKKTDGGMGTVAFKDNGIFGEYYYLAVSTRARFSISTGSRDLSALGTRDINDGKWHHVAGVRTAPQALQVYVDGVLEGTAADPRPTSPAIGATSPFRIGVGTVLPGVGYFKGSLDDVRIYNRALSADEIKALYLGR